MKPFLILEASRPIDPLQRHGSFGHWIRVAAGLHGREVRHCRVADGESLPDPALAREGTCHSSLLTSARPAPQARRVRKRFIHTARRRG